ncbi:MAG: ankyrin repeat domain-containing protein [Pseudolysinimonas sp.]
MSARTTSQPSLLEAAANGERAQLEALVAAGADLNEIDRHGRSPIMVAALGRHYDVVQSLVDRGADFDLQDRVCLNPFLLGCTSGDLALVTLMLDAGTDLTRVTRFGGNGITPASEKGFLDIVEKLLADTDINVNHTNWVGWTPLIEAIILNDGGPRQQRIVTLLLEHGADPLMTDKYGVTPRALAEQHEYSEIAALLASFGG